MTVFIPVGCGSANPGNVNFEFPNLSGMLNGRAGVTAGPFGTDVVYATRVVLGRVSFGVVFSVVVGDQAGQKFPGP